MIKFDTEKGHLMLCGSGIEIIADMTMLVTKAFFKMGNDDGDSTRSLIKMYSGYLATLAEDTELIEKLKKDDNDSFSVNLSHLMNKRE